MEPKYTCRKYNLLNLRMITFVAEVASESVDELCNNVSGGVEFFACAPTRHRIAAHADDCAIWEDQAAALGFKIRFHPFTIDMARGGVWMDAEIFASADLGSVFLIEPFGYDPKPAAVAP
jgi:hypothetical protein